MEQGNIYVFDLKTRKFSTYFIVFKQLGLFGMAGSDASLEDKVQDMKCHYTKMHRLLISYARTAIIVFSINKNRCIQTLMIKDKLQEKGRALAVEWIGPECREFIVGFEKGLLEVYRAESNATRPVRHIELNPVLMNSLQLTMVQRPKSHYYLIIVYTRDMSAHELEK